ncbi:MAG: right-handed parallel beta-helix repeat-containing protein [Gammaproteobacteria bacterium]|nr:right-handed parallel beta-helix repeat-containing protein [Gammaproteobacteria bacterium]
MKVKMSVFGLGYAGAVSTACPPKNMKRLQINNSSILLFILLSFVAEAALSCADNNVRYAQSNNRIYVEEGAVCTLTEINALTLSKYSSVTPGQLLEEVSPGRWLLKSELHIADGSTLALHGTGIGGDVDELRLLSENEPSARHIKIQVKYGNIEINNTFITSWDPLTQEPDTDSGNGRAYIHVNSLEVDGSAQESRMDIINSEVAYLGYAAAESYGLVWKVRGGNIDPTIFDRVDVYGDIINSYIHHNYMGMYSFGAFGMEINNNEIANNESYGLDPHDDSDSIVITNNDVHDNGNHGIICSRRCSDFVVTDNESYRNRHGIMLHRDTNDSLVENNNVYDNRDTGIAVFESHRNIIRNNIVRRNENGIRLSLGSHNNLVENNLIENNEKNGLYQYMGSDAPETTNGRPSQNNFVRNTVTGNGSLIKVRDSDDILFENNIFEYQGIANVAIYDSTNINILNNTHAVTQFKIRLNGNSDFNGNAVMELDEDARIHINEFSTLELRNPQGRVLNPEENSSVIHITAEGSSLTLNTGMIGTTSTVSALPLWVSLTGGEVTLSKPELNNGQWLWSVISTTGTTNVEYRIGELSPNTLYEIRKDNVLLTTVTADENGEVRFSDSAAENKVEYKLAFSGTPLVLDALADTYVRDGSYFESNFGTVRSLAVKKAGEGFNREAYFIFDLTGVTTVTRARVRFAMELSRAGSVETNLYASTTNWTENTLTWNIKPVTLQLLGSVTVDTENFIYYEFDVTDYINSELNQESTQVGFTLKNPVNSTPVTRVRAREGAENEIPQLDIQS